MADLMSGMMIVAPYANTTESTSMMMKDYAGPASQHNAYVYDRKGMTGKLQPCLYNQLFVPHERGVSSRSERVISFADHALPSEPSTYLIL